MDVNGSECEHIYQTISDKKKRNRRSLTGYRFQLEDDRKKWCSYITQTFSITCQLSVSNQYYCNNNTCVTVLLHSYLTQSVASGPAQHQTASRHSWQPAGEQSDTFSF